MDDKNIVRAAHYVYFWTGFWVFASFFIAYYGCKKIFFRFFVTKVITVEKHENTKTRE